MTATTPTRTRRVEGLVPEHAALGGTLLAIGAILIAGFAIPDVDRFTLLAVSAVLLVAFGVTREYGYAIPAGITGGLGTMVVLTSAAANPATAGATFFLSMAGGFVAIWILGLVARPREVHPWPLVPATVLGLLGLALAAGQPGAISWLQAGIALAFVAGGALLLVRRPAA